VLRRFRVDVGYRQRRRTARPLIGCESEMRSRLRDPQAWPAKAIPRPLPRISKPSRMMEGKGGDPLASITKYIAKKVAPTFKIPGGELSRGWNPEKENWRVHQWAMICHSGVGRSGRPISTTSRSSPTS